MAFFLQLPHEEQSRLDALDAAECRQAKASGRQVKLALRPSVKHQGPSISPWLSDFVRMTARIRLKLH